MLQICRTCLQEIQDSNYFTLTNNTVAIIIKNQLALCVPEMVLDIVSEPVMCYLCVAALHSAFDFKYRCLQSEERIRNYIQNSTMHSNTNGVNLAEMFASISEAVTYANTVGLTQEAHFENDSDTSLDIKYEIIPIDEEDLTKPNIEILGNVYCQPSINEHVPLQTSSRVHQEMCSLERLCESEELQLQFNCVFMEQPEFAKVTCTEKEFPVVPTIPCNNGSYSLEDWLQFEERYLGFTCFEEASHSKCEEGAHSVSSHTTDHSYARRRIEVVPISEMNQPLAKRPRLIRAAKRKVELQISPYNPKTTLKRKKIASKKHLKLKKSVRSHKCNATKNILKCSECEYTTQLQMNLELHSISHININNDLESKMKTNSNVQECTTIDSEKRSSVYCCKGYQCLKYDYSTQKTFKSDKGNFNKRNKTSKSDNIEKIPCFKTNHREKLFRNNHIEHHKKDEVEVQSFKSDHNKDKCLIRAHSEDRSAVSYRIDEHQSLESNHNDEGHSDKNNSEDNQSLIIQSTIHNFLTDDHIEINKKEHVKKLKHSTNDSAEEDKLFKSSHNTDGKVHTYTHINPLENNYDQNGKNNFNVTDQFLKNNSNKEKLLENGHIQKDQLFKKHGIEVNQYLNYKNIKENMASKDNTIEVDKSKSANHLEVSQSDKNDCNEKNYSKSGDDTEVKASTADRSMEHQFLKNDKVERNSDSRIDHIKVDKSFECDQIGKNNMLVNNCIEGDKTKSDDIKVDKPFECDNTENNKNLEDSCNKKDEIIDKCKWSFKNDNVEKVESNYCIKENSTCSSHHTEKEQSFKDDRIHKDKSMCDDHIEDQSTKTNHFVDAESKINSNEWNKSFESDSVEKQQLVKDDNTENKCSEKDQSNSEKDQSFKNCFREENNCFKSDNTERVSLNTDYIEGDQLFKNNKFGQSLKSDQLDGDHSLKSEKGQFPQQIPSEKHKYLKNVKFKNYRVEDDHTEEKHIFKNITEDQSPKYVMKSVQPLKHDLNESNLSNKDNDIQALFKTECAKKTECSKNTNKEDNKIYGSDHITGESGPTQDKKSDYENEYLTTSCQTSKNNYIEQNKSFKTDYRGEKGSIKFHSEEQSIKKTEVKSSKNDYGKKFFKGTHIGEFFKNTQSKKRKRSTSDCVGIELSQSDHSAEKLTSNRIKRKLGSAKKFFKSEVSNEKSSKTNYCMKDTISKCTNSDEIESCGCIKCEFAATLKNDLQERIKLVLEKRHSTEEKINT